MTVVDGSDVVIDDNTLNAYLFVAIVVADDVAVVEYVAVRINVVAAVVAFVIDAGMGAVVGAENPDIVFVVTIVADAFVVDTSMGAVADNVVVVMVVSDAFVGVADVVVVVGVATMDTVGVAFVVTFTVVVFKFFSWCFVT